MNAPQGIHHPGRRRSEENWTAPGADLPSYRRFPCPRGLDSVVVNPRVDVLFRGVAPFVVYCGERPAHHPRQNSTVVFSGYRRLPGCPRDSEGREVYRVTELFEEVDP